MQVQFRVPLATRCRALQGGAGPAAGVLGMDESELEAVGELFMSKE